MKKIIGLALGLIVGYLIGAVLIKATIYEDVWPFKSKPSPATYIVRENPSDGTMWGGPSNGKLHQLEDPRLNLPEIQELERVTKKRGLAWKIWCAGHESFYGWSGEPGQWGKNYIEDGAKAVWIEIGASERKTAASLVKALKHPPDIKPRHKPVEEKPEVCAPMLEGGIRADRTDKGEK